jgi:hypothetical protein
MNFVVDSNVMIAANGRDTHAGLTCQYACAEFLETLVSTESPDSIVLDEPGLIFKEYSRYLNYHGQPGVGDMFFKHLHTHLYGEAKVRRVAITEVADEARGFAELPLNTLDKSDRKFLAAALVAEAAIVNALDTDWHEQAAFVAGLGVSVRQLCPEHGCQQAANSHA